MNALTFHDTPISIIERGGMPWMAGHEIGTALGYQNPGKQISKLYTRNKAEFSEEMTCVANLATEGQRRAFRLFSPRGALLLAMHAKTDRAVAFRAWVLDILEGKIPLPGRADRQTRLIEALMIARPRWQRHLFYVRAGLTQGEIARLEGVSSSLVHLDGKALRRLGLLDTPSRGPRGAGQIAQERRAVLFAAQEEVGHAGT